VKAADIPDDAILDIVRMFNEGRQPPQTLTWKHRDDMPDQILEPAPAWCLIWDLEERLPQYPRKVIMAKCRSLIRRGLLTGCTCGCRGDFELPEYAP
jgi:hypothetical protein